MTTSLIQGFINSIPDKRIARAFTEIYNRTMPSKLDTAITATAGGTKAAAQALKSTCSFHDVTTVATAADSILMPPAKEGEFHFVKNSGAASMQVFGQGTDTIDSVATGTGVEQLAGDGVMYYCLIPGNWLRIGGVGATEVFSAITTTDLTVTNPITYGLGTTITAFATGGQASATALTKEFNNVTTCATASDSVKLPAAAAGKVITVKNSGAAACAVFPASGDAINAMAVNLSVDLAPGGQMTFRAIDGTTWETEEFLTSQAPSTQKGSLVVKAADSAGNTVTTITNASQAAARTYTVPDAGASASFLMTEGAQTINGVQTYTLPRVADHNTGITAFAGGGQASATALTGEWNNITTCATAADSVKLPAAVLGQVITVKNSGATTLAVFPATGDAINALAANLSVDVAVSSEMTFRAIDATTWETNEVITLPAPTTQKGSLVIQAADSAGNTNTTITNASQAAARTYTIPDAGASASFAMTEGAQTLNGVQTYTVPRVLDSNTGITAFATGGQASATALTGEYNTVTVCATANDSVKLPAAVAGQIVTVRNIGAAICAVFPASGDAINALAADLSISLPVLGEITFEAVDGTTWYTKRAMSLQAPTTQRGNLVIKVADNAANHEVSVVNASHGQATTHTIPDPGAAAASFVLTEGAQTINGVKTFGNEVDLSGNVMSTEAGAGITGGVGTVYKSSVVKVGGIIKTSILLDLTGLSSSTTDLDIIGQGASVAHLGQITAARNGTILTGRVTCLEAPVGGVTDIDLYSATEGTGVFDGAVGDLTETALLTSGAAWTIMRELALTAVPAANSYLYLTGGAAGTAAPYTAGKYLIELEGYDA